MSNKPKLLMLGWDAADWQVIDRLLAEDKMPTLKKLIERGVRGNIATLRPVLSPMLWTSIATGKRAYQHGIHGFVEQNSLNGEIEPVKSSSRKVKAVWNMLNEAELRTNVINWWPSHPAEKLKGNAVSNHLHRSPPAKGAPWPLDENCCYPEEWSDRLAELRVHPEELGLAHLLPFIPEAERLDPERNPILKTVRRILAHTASVHAAATEVMEQSSWDFMAVYQESIDHFSHLAMKYHPPRMEGIKEEEFALYHQIIEAAYRFHDMMLERLLELAGEDCHVILLSDHGFESGSMRVEELPDVPAAPALEHRPYGVFVAAGPAFSQGETVYGASLLDICPTILHLFDLPLGEDMEGRVLQEIFRQPQSTSTIESWERTAVRPAFTGISGSSEESLRQLADLGYLNLPQENKQSYVRAELLYNLCQSLTDGAKWEEAAGKAKEGWREFGELRYGLLYANVLLKLGQLEELRQILAEIRAQYPAQAASLFLEGMLCLQENRQEEALQYFQKLSDLGAVSPELYQRMAQSFLVSGNLKAAREYYQRVLSLDAENVTALTGLGQVALERLELTAAMDLLDQSLQLRFYQPRAHYLMAQTALAIGYAEMARKALQLCLQQAPRHEAAARLWQQHFASAGSEQASEEVIVVSGLPRSGTSMLMQMLAAAGIPVFSDGERNQDEHNPLGYLEHAKVKDLGRDGSWISEARAKVVKVVSPLLRYLPSSERYRIVVIKRPLTEVLLSQQLMRGHSREEVMRDFPFQLAVDLQQEQERLHNWLSMQPNIEFLEIEYYDCLENTAAVAQRLSKFLKREMPLEKISAVIEGKLHRNKLGK